METGAVTGDTWRFAAGIGILAVGIGLILGYVAFYVFFGKYRRLFMLPELPPELRTRAAAAFETLPEARTRWVRFVRDRKGRRTLPRRARRQAHGIGTAPGPEAGAGRRFLYTDRGGALTLFWDSAEDGFLTVSEAGGREQRG